MKWEKQQTWHDKDVDYVLTHLNTDKLGLSESEVKNRIDQYGWNSLPQAPKKGLWRRWFQQFHHVLIYVLLASAAITLVLNHLVDGGVILAVVIINALIGFLQEGKAEKAINLIRHMLAPKASILRDGKRQTVLAETLVPGDVVLLEAGDKVPSDLRLFQVHGLMIQEAILTGESIPVEKQTEPVPQDAMLGDRTCLAFSGTLIVSGQGKGIVIATGADTEIGRISGLLTEVKTLSTPLVKQMSIFTRWLTGVILMVALLILTIGYLVQGYEFVTLFMAVVALSVAAIPEGLPAVLTITLAIGVQKMAKRHAIVRHLPAIETLGALAVICTDKTGTLTQNEMMVVSLVTAQHHFSVTGDGYSPEGNIQLEDKTISGEAYSHFDELARVALLCNEAALHEKEGVWTVEGDPMEGALLAFAWKTGLDETAEVKTWVGTDTIPFDSKHRFMAKLFHDHEQHGLIVVKGAPENMLMLCTKQINKFGEPEDLDKSYWDEYSENIANQGQRVLALAMKPVPSGHLVLEFGDLEGLILLGFVGLLDPPRIEVTEAVAECYQAGIQIKMITGDHVGTAAAIGRQIGLQNAHRVLTGADLDALDDSTLNQVVLDTNIYARTSPEHKLRLVMALQSHQLIVAMTGDGVNDTPALKRADAGIAMGKKGSEAAKEVADVVLVDDNFASIVAAVREGRTVYDNIKKVIGWSLPTNAGEATIIIFALLLGITLPITPLQILWINLITAVTLGVALAFEPTEDNTMHRRPRRPNEPLLTAPLVWHIVFVSILFAGGTFGMFSYALKHGHSIELARTIALNTLVVFEIFHLFYIRNIYGTSITWKAAAGTPMIWLTVGIVIVAQFALPYLSVLQRIFYTEGVSFLEGIAIVGVGILFFAILEIEKQLRLRILPMRWSAR